MSIIIIIVVIIVEINLVLYLGAKKETHNSKDRNPHIDDNADDIYTNEVQTQEKENQRESNDSEKLNDSENESDKEIFIPCPKCNNKGWEHGVSSMGSEHIAHTLASSLTGKETLDKKGTSKIGFRARGKYGLGEDIWVCNSCDSAVKFHLFGSIDNVILIDEKEYSILKSDFEKGTGLEY